MLLQAHPLKNVETNKYVKSPLPMQEETKTIENKWNGNTTTKYYTLKKWKWCVLMENYPSDGF